jgi:predicted cupin superfamily sugar epimerase
MPTTNPIDMSAAELIARLELARHPEGGWYRETWRSPVSIGDRSAGSAIYFLLEEGQKSEWHRVDADEFWLWHGGSSLELRIGTESESSVESVVLGPNTGAGERPQVLVPARAWQSAVADSGWALVSCLVIPAFDFAGFDLASSDVTVQLDAQLRQDRVQPPP